MRFVLLLLLFALCFVATAQDFILNADFVLEKTSGSPLELSTFGRYTGTMFYFQNSTHAFRKMTYTKATGSAITVDERFATAYINKDLVTGKMTTCNGKCTIKFLYQDKVTYLYLARETLDKAGSYPKSYIKKVVYDGAKLKSFDTIEGVTVTLSNVVTSTTSVEVPQNFFENCVRSSCEMRLDFVMSFDISGSMLWGAVDNSSPAYGKARFDYARDIALELLERFNMNPGKTHSALVTWEMTAYLKSPSSISTVKSTGFVKERSQMVSDLTYTLSQNRIGGGTCLVCGYKAGIETLFAQYLYETKSSTDRVNYARVLLIFTDGAPTAVFYTGSNPAYTVSASNNYVYWSYGSGNGSGEQYDATLTQIAYLKGNGASSFYGEALKKEFFDKITIIVMFAFASTNDNVNKVLAAVGKPGGTNTNMKTSYVISTMDEAEKKKMLDELDGAICDVDPNTSENECTDGRPCCADKVCPECSLHPSLLCLKDEGSCTANRECSYPPKCSTVDKCKNLRCEESNGECILTDKVIPTDTIINYCYFYKCKASTGVWEKDASVDCTTSSNYKPACHLSPFCREDLPKATGPIGTDQSVHLPDVCGFVDKCACKDLMPLEECEQYYEKDPDASTCDDLIGKRYIDTTKQNCRVSKCFVYDKPNKAGEKWGRGEEDVVCTGECMSCDKADSECHPNDYICLEAVSNTDKYKVGCHAAPVCSEDGKCLEPKDLCAGDLKCMVYDCIPDEANVNNDPNAPPQYKCDSYPLPCPEPPRDDPFINKCYTKACVEERGGCFFTLDIGALNSCGNCESELKCDATTVVVATSIAAGVVVAIVIAAIVALVVAGLASKKIYDLVSSSRDTRMDAANENQLYEGNDNEGINPLFSGQ